MERLVPRHHILRRVKDVIDFSAATIGLNLFTQKKQAGHLQMLNWSCGWLYWSIYLIPRNGNCLKRYPCMQATSGFAAWILSLLFPLGQHLLRQERFGVATLFLMIS